MRTPSSTAAYRNRRTSGQVSWLGTAVLKRSYSLNRLDADPRLCSRYEFWFFSYNSGEEVRRILLNPPGRHRCRPLSLRVAGPRRDRQRESARPPKAPERKIADGRSSRSSRGRWSSPSSWRLADILSAEEGSFFPAIRSEVHAGDDLPPAGMRKGLKNWETSCSKSGTLDAR